MSSKTIISVIFGLTSLLQGCGSSDGGVTVSADVRPESSRPAVSTQANLFNEIIAPALEAPEEPATESENLFSSNSDFENGIAGWQGCRFDSITASDQAHEGNSAVEIKAQKCLLRSVKAIPGESYTFSCYVKLASQHGWTGMGINFSDAFKSLQESPIAIATSSDYARISTTGIAPDAGGTEAIHVWLYSDQGAYVDNCSLTLSSELPPIEPIDQIELLANGDFSRADNKGIPADWSTGCGGRVIATSPGLNLGDGACADQALSASVVNNLPSHETTTFSCLVTEVSGYSDLSIFLDNKLVGFRKIDAKEKNSRVSISIDNSAYQPVNGFVSLFSEGNLQVEDCVLRLEEAATDNSMGDSFSESENALVSIPINGKFDQLDADGYPTGWSPNTFGCPGDNWSVVSDNGENHVVVKDYTCLEYKFGAAEIELLEGKSYTYSCRVELNGEIDAGGGIAISLDGDAVLAKAFDAETSLEIIKTAPATITSGLVEIYSAGHIKFLECSLTTLP